MKEVYLDNAATTKYKPKTVLEDMSSFMKELNCSPGRGGYECAIQSGREIMETRFLISDFFNAGEPENVIFTKNITESLNFLIKGLLKKGDHVVTTSMEHNAVMRPLNALANKIKYTKAKCNNLGDLDIEDFKNSLKSNTKAVVMTHASNVCGTILDLEKVGKICKENGIYFIIDSAQTAGFLDIDFNKLSADALGFTGHKSLLGPQGIGGFVLNDNLAGEMSTFIEGGTGSLSDTEIQPDYMPDKFEAGTLNIPGIYGLNASLKYLLKEGLSSVRKKELELLDKFMQGIYNIENIEIIGKKNIDKRTGILSLDFTNKDNGII